MRWRNSGLPAFTSTPARRRRPKLYLSLQTLLLLTALSFLPAVLLMMTGFTRIIIVLSLLRQALGTQSSPPNQVLVGLALFLTFFVMGPVFDKIYTRTPTSRYADNKITMTQALEQGVAPLQGLHAEADPRGRSGAVRQAFRHAAAERPGRRARCGYWCRPLHTSELKTAFQIGFTVFIPFLIIDMVVASVLMSMGMMMVSPVLVALPFKLMLFVLVDGWHLLIGSLAESFY